MSQRHQRKSPQPRRNPWSFPSQSVRWRDMPARLGVPLLQGGLLAPRRRRPVGIWFDLNYWGVTLGLIAARRRPYAPALRRKRRV